MEHGLSGFAWAVGVPGTIGGAVRGNAGAMGKETKDVVAEVDAYRDGDVVTLTHAACAFGYRDSVFKHVPMVVLRVRLGLTKGDKQAGLSEMMNCIGYRTKTQPKGHASTGCIFKNVDLAGLKGFLPEAHPEIPKDFFDRGRISAGWLVEAVGMKGAEAGDVWVSPVHGNFIVNRGQGCAADVRALIERIKEKVYDRFGIVLEEEIELL